MQSEFFRDLANEEPLSLKDSDVKLYSSFVNPEFDNDDSEFAEIRLHYLSNVGTGMPYAIPEEVPMMECDIKKIDGLDPEYDHPFYPGKIYCPDWKDEHMMFSDWNAPVSSWFFLAVHKCDPDRRALKGKECASDEKINDFFDENIFSLMIGK